jgi:hypothetical protein
MFENRMSEYRQVLPLLQQIRALGIDIDKLIAFNVAVCAPRNKAITSLLKLQNYGITDDEISNVCEFLNRARFESAATIIKQNGHAAANVPSGI